MTIYLANKLNVYLSGKHTSLVVMVLCVCLSNLCYISTTKTNQFPLIYTSLKDAAAVLLLGR